MTSIALQRRSPTRKTRKDKDVAKRAVVNFYYELLDYSQQTIADLTGLSPSRVSQLLSTSEHYQRRPERVWRLMGRPR